MVRGWRICFVKRGVEDVKVVIKVGFLENEVIKGGGLVKDGRG